ncbi:MAG TPA: hypothetical protein VH087_14020 [Thermoanaerobaculia bacterium]|jgi:hypothetical protein|nr:hypothetical protein [Thermoanaerobaculia bacterium]
MEQRIEERRITLVARGGYRDWETTELASSAIMAIDSLSDLTLTIVDLWIALDIERVILDGAATASQFLDLLTALPQEFNGDAMMIRSDGAAFLSAISRGSGRVLYTLTASDVDFYLQANGLVPFDTQPQLRIA